MAEQTEEMWENDLPFGFNKNKQIKTSMGVESMIGLWNGLQRRHKGLLAFLMLIHIVAFHPIAIKPLQGTR
ncbi:hypothetical protein ACJX0J_022194, partial [Zea mays]